MNINSSSQVDFIVGFSGNPELIVEADLSTLGQKIMAKKIEAGLAGGAVTVGYVAERLSAGAVRSKVLVATGREENWRDILLESFLSQLDLAHVQRLQVRESGHTGIAVRITNSHDQLTKVVGDKGNILYEPTASGVLPVELVHQHVHEYPNTVRISTGVMPDEIRLVAALYDGTSRGSILNPRLQLTAMTREFTNLARRVDVVIMNDDELGGFLGKDANAITDADYLSWAENDLAPLLIVTRNSNGAVVLYHDRLFKISGYKHGQCHSEVSGGDWWLGAFLAAVEQNIPNQPISKIDEDLLKQAARFATVAAGLKVTYRNGNLDGPGLNEVEEHLKDASCELKQHSIL